ncbi:MAG: 50S ribosome-binding GTPase [Planctomycetes bacterium]|nr:50S ribosome-binding GTPase [Planctomycetota bacterium]
MASPSPNTSSDETVAALVTALAPGAIAVIALNGPRTTAILTTILRKPKSDQSPEFRPDTPTLCRIIDNDQTLDDAIVLISDAHHAELHTHGGVRIAQRVLMLLAAHGATIVSSDDFIGRTSTASPVERAIDAALIRSQSRRLTNWLLAQRELLPPFLARLDQLSAADRAAFDHRSHIAARLLRGITIALIGPPNAGKSTLANRLIGHDRVITSDQPGTTRDWITETALIHGWPVTLTDTAGLRDADCAIEAEAIRRGTQQAHTADLVLIVLDATAPADVQRAALDRGVATLPASTPRIVVFNKCDSSTALPIAMSGANTSAISALQGVGIDDLESQIEATLELNLLDENLPTGIVIATT